VGMWKVRIDAVEGVDQGSANLSVQSHLQQFLLQLQDLGLSFPAISLDYLSAVPESKPLPFSSIQESGEECVDVYINGELKCIPLPVTRQQIIELSGLSGQPSGLSVQFLVAHGKEIGTPLRSIPGDCPIYLECGEKIFVRSVVKPAEATVAKEDGAEDGKVLVTVNGTPIRLTSPASYSSIIAESGFLEGSKPSVTCKFHDSGTYVLNVSTVDKLALRAGMIFNVSDTSNA
jgi:hypothetical protein